MVYRRTILLAACWAVSILPFAKAYAEGQADTAAAVHLLGKMPDKTAIRACFTRVYDMAHLAGHPQQKVAAMMLLVKGENDSEENRVNYTFTLGIKLRAKMARYTSAGNCGHAQIGDAAGAITLSCGVDCDGGGLAIALARDDNSTLVSFSEIAISPAGDDDESARTSLKAGADDRSFRLDRARLADCVPLAVDKEDAAAIRRGE